jgi:UDPglucose 6-dehydrogenase
VTVTDLDAARIERIATGRAPFFEPDLDDALAVVLAAGTLRPTAEPGPPADAAFSIVCVPTPAGSDGILSTAYVEAAVGGLLERSRPDQVIVVRSTLPLGGPDRLLDMVAGVPTRPPIVVNPEFMREGRAVADFDAPGRIVVGWLAPEDRSAATAFAELYAPLDRPVVFTDARSAVLIKIASNVYLATKISFANELARLADAVGADIATVTDGLGLDPRIGRSFLDPGPGYGGSCLPEQAVALDREAAARGVPAPLLAGVAAANGVHQAAIVTRLAADLGGSLEGRRIAVLGLAFKAGTDDVRHSPGLALASGLRSAGALVTGHDPRASETARRADPDLGVAATVEEAVGGVDAILIATEWPEYGSLNWPGLAARMRGDLVHDTRAIADATAVAAAGLRLVPLGRRGLVTHPVERY